MGVEGIFGVPLDVAATYIVLFTIYGAVLEYSGAGRYFIDVSFAAFGRSAAAPARTVTLAGFLLGTVSGSGVATTVTLGSVAWPVLRRAGYPRDQGGGVLAASGIGAILSPPTLGAAAFIIAEFLNVSYLQVLLFAIIPTVLYYLGIVLAIEADSRRFRTRAVELDTPPLGRLLLRWGYHFSSLFLIVILMAFGLSPFRAVLYATVAAFLLSFLDRSTWMTPRRTWEALAAGAIGVLPVAATTAAAGIIVAVVTLTGLGLKVSSIIVDLAGGRLGLAALYSAIAVLVLGLAVPVTASFIIAAVIIGPALTTLGVEPFAAYMFIFYYAVLSEVSPPTALSAVAAAAITGGNPFRTMMLTWRYTLPAFLVPFAFVLSPRGEALLLEGPVGTILLALAVSVVAVAALALATGAWLAGPAGWPERVLASLAAVLLLYLEPAAIGAGLALAAAAVAVHLLTRRRRAAGGAAPAGEAGRPVGEDDKPRGPDETDETDETTEARRQP
jgi:TRAP transporter 4TM/12TM fusion protein